MADRPNFGQCCTISPICISLEDVRFVNLTEFCPFFIGHCFGSKFNGMDRIGPNY